MPPSVETTRSLLRQCALFAAVDDPILDILVAAALIERNDRGALLFLQGAPATRFFVILAGRIKVYRASADGREQVLHVFGPGDICGEVPMFQGGTYPASGVATRCTRTLSLTRTDFLKICRESPEILLSMLASLSERLRRFVGMIEDLSLRRVPARLARALIEQSRVLQRPVFELEESKVDLAGRLGTTPESLSRALTLLRNRQIIGVHGRTIRIKQPQQLAEIAET